MAGVTLADMDLKSILLIAAVVLAVMFAVKRIFPSVPGLNVIAGAVG